MSSTDPRRAARPEGAFEAGSAGNRCSIERDWRRGSPRQDNAALARGGNPAEGAEATAGAAENADRLLGVIMHRSVPHKGCVEVEVRRPAASSRR
jgi:hypothetical protein